MSAAATSIAIPRLTGGDLVRKFNDGDDGSLPDGRIAADRMSVADWRGAARKTQRNQAEFMEHVGEEARKTEVIVRDDPVVLTTDTGEDGCGVFIKSEGEAPIKLTKAVYGYDKAVTQDSMNGFYMGVVSGNKIHQCVPVDLKGEKPADLKEAEKTIMRQLALMAQLYTAKKAAETGGDLDPTQAGKLTQAISLLQRNDGAIAKLYDEDSSSTKKVEDMVEELQKMHKRFPKSLAFLTSETESKAFAEEIVQCAKSMYDEDGCKVDSSSCGWVERMTPFGKKGFCVPKNGSTFKTEAGLNVGESGFAKWAQEDPKKRSAPHYEAVKFWQDAANAEAAAVQKGDNAWWSQMQAAQRKAGVVPPVNSRLAATFAGGEVPSVFSTAGSEAGSTWSASEMRVF